MSTTKLNKRNFNRLISAIKKTKPQLVNTTPEGKWTDSFFNLSRWQYDCGAPACMAGHGGLVFGNAEFKAKLHNPLGGRHTSPGTQEEDLIRITAEALGLEIWWAKHYLFAPVNFVRMLYVIPEDAIAALTVVKNSKDYQGLTGGEVWGSYLARRKAEREAALAIA